MFREDSLGTNDDFQDAPYKVTGVRIFLRGSDYFSSVGNVSIERDSLLAFADSAEYEGESEGVHLIGSASVEVPSYSLVGETIDMSLETNNFNRIVRFLEAKFGPPEGEMNQSIALIAGPPKLNITVKWKRRIPDGSTSVLEARKFDNIQRMIPDTKIGFIRLYREGTRPIFRTINESDLMVQSLRNSPREPSYNANQERQVDSPNV